MIVSPGPRSLPPGSGSLSREDGAAGRVIAARPGVAPQPNGGAVATPAAPPLLVPIPLPLDEAWEAADPAYLLLTERIDDACLESIGQLAPNRDALILVAYSSGGDAQELQALEAGADACVPLGFSLEDVLTRFRRLARRRAPLVAAGAAAPAAPPTRLQLDEERYQVRLDGQRVRLSPLEFRLLAELWRQRGRLVPRERVEVALYGAAGGRNRQAVRQVVHRLRAKLGAAGELIQAVAGVGFVLSADDPRESGWAPALGRVRERGWR